MVMKFVTPPLLILSAYRDCSFFAISVYTITQQLRYAVMLVRQLLWSCNHLRKITDVDGAEISVSTLPNSSAFSVCLMIWKFFFNIRLSFTADLNSPSIKCILLMKSLCHLEGN
ncbi:hypothetical protein T09_8225 [Trichinella sp. T9]|nr:hypothetical protein T09_8225 [Trichinella sp. T9]